MIPAGWDIVTVDTLADPRIDAYRDLTDMDLRLRQEADGGHFMAEGLLVIERASQLGLEIRSVLTAPKWLDRLASILARWSGPVYVTDEAQAITGYRVHRGALAEVRRPAPREAADLVRGDGDLLLLEDLVDHTNVGLAFRSAAALGITGVVLSPGCADPLYRRAVKVSMGAVLALPWARSHDWATDLHTIAHDRHLIGLTPDTVVPTLERVLADASSAPTALLLGTEGAGLSALACTHATALARIPMEAGVDSLNVAAATAVACYALRMSRERAGAP